MYIDKFKYISDVDELEKMKAKQYVFFDLDETVIGTVFTNATPKECMRFYKKSVTDNRYSILRPGIKDLLEKIRNDLGYPIAMITNAKYKRAYTILTQFGILSYFDFIISKECLDTLEEKKGISCFCKPMDVFGGILLFDDRKEALEYNQKKCVQVKPFLAKYDENDVLKVCADNQTWVPYSVEFVCEEAECVRSWGDKLFLGVNNESFTN